MNIQLRRPSDGAVSESRTFDFIPLDAGRAYWSAKRLKTNFNVFNQILSRDQALRQGDTAPPEPPQSQELKHKVPLSRAPVMAGMFNANSSTNLTECNGDSSLMSPQLGQMRQTLKPVAMPGAVSNNTETAGAALQSSHAAVTAVSAAPHVNYPGQMTDNDNTSQLHTLGSLQHRSQPAVSAVPQIPSRTPQKPAMFDQLRPASDISLMSDMSSLTQADNISLATRQSVNEILSLADVSVFSGDTINLDNISVNTLLNNPLGMQPSSNSSFGLQPSSMQSNTLDIKLEPKLEPTEAVTNSNTNLSSAAATNLGSMTSVSTVKENQAPVTHQNTNMSPMDVTDITVDTFNEAMDTLGDDIGQIYDDVMQCVYDDVDIKYDDVTLLMDQPPVPPQRKQKETNIDADIVPDIDKPLPAAPKNNILTKLTEKKNELMTAREKELEKKKREREELEEQKRKEKEEKERKKKEEKEAKKREEEEKKAKLDEQKLKSSLFQRLFQRSQSRASGQDDQEPGDQDQDMVTSDTCDTCPPVPAHQQLGYMSQASMDARLSELEQLISASNNGAEIELEKLDDNILSELTRQYPPEGGAGLSATATPTNDINQSQPVQT